MAPLAHKYYAEPLLTIGFAILAVSDPVLVPHMAIAILQALRGNGQCTISAEEEHSFLALPVNTLLAALFTPSSITHAFPNVTFAEYREAVRQAFTLPSSSDKTTTAKVKREEIIGIVGAHALCSPAAIRELKLLATDALRSALRRKNKDIIPGTPVKHYWQDVEELPQNVFLSV
jgi:hypothetical protein